MFRFKCSLRNQRSLVFFGTKRETASANNCHPWTNTYVGGLALQWSSNDEVAGLDGAVMLWFGDPGTTDWVVLIVGDEAKAASQVNSDCVAHNKSC